ncbi:hypothetical protein H6P81_011253 [Aristolochia fimbriata]|uniref:Uncharacterized protein n=1 Tax=Aristolochia fimbriata TaxID=158543 RepID=A0AAV7ERD8_ARIFI|nr:hypothetical protein H6P81_011253 [Aristolochia fimbriata]
MEKDYRITCDYISDFWVLEPKPFVNDTRDRIISKGTNTPQPSAQVYGIFSGEEDEKQSPAPSKCCKSFGKNRKQWICCRPRKMKATSNSNVISTGPLLRGAHAPCHWSSEVLRDEMIKEAVIYFSDQTTRRQTIDSAPQLSPIPA